MGYVFDFNDARAYEQWLSDPGSRYHAKLENRLMVDMLKPLRGKSFLDIGCGTGARMLPLIQQGLQATGIDPSPYMLDIAARDLGNRAELHRGVAEELPFDDNTFTYACLVTTLEFVDNPQKALEEACRVAKDKVFFGILNRYALKAIQLRVKGMFGHSVYRSAHFFSIWELQQMLRRVLGDVPISWKTICQLPASGGRIANKIEKSNLMQHCPFGAFVGMVVTLVPRFRTDPLPITYRAKHTTGEATG